MDALVMCGGRGTRLDVAAEKPLFEVGGAPMVDRVVGALADSRIEIVHPVVSRHTPETRAHFDGPVVETAGDGYVADLGDALDRAPVDTPVLTVAADLPLLDGSAIDTVLDAYERGSLAVCVLVRRKRDLDLSVGETIEHDGRSLAPAGVNVVDDGSESVFVTEDVRFAVNVNTLADASVAERLLAR